MSAPMLSKSELAALVAVDGTRAQPEMSPKIRLRLYDLGLIERREWPDGPLWRTAMGTRRARRALGAGKGAFAVVLAHGEVTP